MAERSGARRQRSSIRDIAERAKVSTSTVSHVINKTRYVSPEKRELVQQIIDELDYRPNVQAQSLKGQYTKTLGLIVSDFTGTFFYHFVNTVGRCSHRSDYDVLVCNSENETDTEKRHIDMLLRKGVDGIIFAPVDHRTHHKEIESWGIPIVQIERENDHYEADYVGIDDYGEAEKVYGHYASRGLRKIGLLMHGGGQYLGRRHAGYKDSAEAHGAYAERLIKRIALDPRPGFEAAADWLERNGDLEAVMCTSLEMCLLALKGLEHAGMTQTRLFSFTDDPWLDYAIRPIASLRHPIEKIAETAVECLMERIEGADAPARRLSFPCEFIDR